MALFSLYFIRSDLRTIRVDISQALFFINLFKFLLRSAINLKNKIQTQISTKYVIMNECHLNNELPKDTFMRYISMNHGP